MNPVVLSRSCLTALVLAAFAGCSTIGLPPLEGLPGPSDLPFIHKIDIQQGNILTQEMLAQLRQGMDKKKIVFIMGTPIIEDTFNANRWDYIYTYMPGGGQVERRSVTLVFADDKLAYVEGDVVAATEELSVAAYTDMTVEVPLYQRKSYISKLKEKMPFAEISEVKPVYDVKNLPNAKDIPPGSRRTSTVDDAKDLPSAKDSDDTETKAPADNDRKKKETTNSKTASAKEVLVPKDSPTSTKKKSFLRRILGGIGVHAGGDEEGNSAGHDPVDPKYRDITNPDNY